MLSGAKGPDASNHPVTTPWNVYIALLEDGRFYIGMTQVHPQERTRRHTVGKGGTFTRGRKVVSILWVEQHATAKSAHDREKQLKKWSHAKKQALIDGDLERLKSLSRSRRK